MEAALIYGNRRTERQSDTISVERSVLYQFVVSNNKTYLSLHAKRTYVFTQSARYFHPTSTKSDLFHKFQTKVGEKIKTHILCPVTFSFENRAVYEMMLKNNVELGGHVTIWRMRTARCIPKATNTACNSYCLPHCNNCCKNVPQCYVIRKLPVRLIMLPSYFWYNAAEKKV
jgi:hypothetical protein